MPDKLKGEHPVLGTFPVYLSYERIPKICLFCAHIGHEHETCPDKQRMERLKVDARYRDNPQMKNLTKPSLGLWVNDSGKLPPPQTKLQQLKKVRTIHNQMNPNKATTTNTCPNLTTPPTTPRQQQNHNPISF